MSRVISQTVASFSRFPGVLDPADVRAYASRIVGMLDANAALLDLRARHGCVRLCHGDLHLRNIVLQNGRPVLFDAIEFDDTLATVDVLYDFAFLLMDLWYRGLERHANECFSTYASAAMSTEALGGLSALPLFLSVRAAVRAMVALDRLGVCHEDERDAISREARAYLDLANRLLETREPILVAVGGCSGTGKTTLAGALAPRIGHAPGALHLRSDVERKRMFGVDPLEPLPRQAYSGETTEKVYKRLCNRAEQALKAGHSVIVDAAFLEAQHRRWVEEIAAKAGVGFTGVWLRAPQEQLVERVTARRNDASDANAAVVMQQMARFTNGTNWETLNAGQSHDAVLMDALRLFGG